MFKKVLYCTYKQNLMKFYAGVESCPRTKNGDFGGDRPGFGIRDAGLLNDETETGAIIPPKF